MLHHTRTRKVKRGKDKTVLEATRVKKREAPNLVATTSLSMLMPQKAQTGKKKDQPWSGKNTHRLL